MHAHRVLPALGAALLLAGCAAQSGGVAARTSTSTAPHDWRNSTYHLTCDGIVPGGFDATLVNGAARVPADVSQTPYYDNFDIRLVSTATGDVDGNGKPDTVALLRCSPQPSNAFVQEVQVFRAGGSLLAELPRPQTLVETTIIAPIYVPGGLSVQHEDVVARMQAYGPGDSHATGPHVPFTVRWHWNGDAFVRVG